MNELQIQEKQINVLNSVLKQFKDEGANIIGNETYINAPPPVGFVHAYEVVNICKDPRFKEVYPQKGGGLSLTAVALKKLGKAMGIKFGPGQVMSRTMDDKGNTLSIIFRSIACCRGLDSQFSWSTMDYEYDLRKRKEEIENTQNEKIAKWTTGLPQEKAAAPPDFMVCRTPDEVRDWRDEKVRIEMIQKEKNALTCAQTGSMTRCIRDLGAIPSTYMPEQLDKPFLVPKLVVYYEATNPIDRAFALEQTKSPMLMFAQEQPRSVPLPAQIAPPSKPSPQLSIDVQAPTPPPAPAEFNLPSSEEKEMLDSMIDPTTTESEVQMHDMEMSPEEAALLDFEACDGKEKVSCIEFLIKDRNWKGKLSKPIDKFTLNEQKNFYLMLIKQPSLPWSE